MKQIHPYSLWLGHADDGANTQQILNAGIQAVVQLAVEVPPLQPYRELIYCRFPLLDGPGNDPTLLRLTSETLVRLLRRQVPTLVCCGGGMCRSPALAALALAQVHAVSPENALEQIARQHPTDLSPAFWQEVRGLLPSAIPAGQASRTAVPES